MAEQKKPALLSSKVMQLKFMQRAQEKQKRAEEAEVAEKRESEAQWVVEGARSRCVVVAEPDPCPAPLGRLSFNQFNPETEKLQAEVEAREARRAAAAADPDGKSISDEALAAELGKRQQKQQQPQAPGNGGKQRQQQQQQQQQQQRQQGQGAQPGADQILPLRPPKRQKR